jgi:hypothetical protein
MSHHRVMIRVLMVVNVMFIMRSGGNMSSVVNGSNVRSWVVGGIGSWVRSVRGWVISMMHVGFMVRSRSWVIGSGSWVVRSGSWVVRSRGRVVRCGGWVHVRFMMMNRVNGVVWGSMMRGSNVVNRVVGGMVRGSMVRHMIGRLLQGMFKVVKTYGCFMRDEGYELMY